MAEIRSPKTFSMPNAEPTVKYMEGRLKLVDAFSGRKSFRLSN